MIEFDPYWIRINLPLVNAQGTPIALYIHYYALILMLGMFVAAWIVARRAREQGLDPEYVWNGLIWAIIPGLIGARLYHVLTPTPASGLSLQYYVQHPLEIFAIWNGGLGVFGGLVGGGIGIIVYARRHKQPLLKWLDLIMPAVLVGQAIGRWGNFVNHELYGAPTTLPWAIYIPPENRVPGYQGYSTFHPLFLYESLWTLASAGLLLLIERRFRSELCDGDLLWIYLILYPTGRFLLDFVRLDSNGFGPLTTAQLVSLLALLSAITILFIRHRQPALARPAIQARRRPESK